MLPVNTSADVAKEKGPAIACRPSLIFLRSSDDQKLTFTPAYQKRPRDS
jgi:hypothetical protein